MDHRVEVNEKLAALGVCWSAADVLETDNAAVNLATITSLLDRIMGDDNAILLQTPFYAHEFTRSRFGKRALMYVSTPRDVEATQEFELACADETVQIADDSFTECPEPLPTATVATTTATAGRRSSKRPRTVPNRLKPVRGCGQHTEQRMKLIDDTGSHDARATRHTVKKQRSTTPPCSEQTLAEAMARCPIPGLKVLSEPHGWVSTALLPGSATAAHFYGEFIA